ncbi:MAG: hypothetical protein AAB966_05295, partial [Patescibacteria group bacterium]
MSKVRLVYMGFCLLFAIIVAKLFYLQIINPQFRSNSGYLNYSKLQAGRGKVLDRNGNPLVLNKPTYRLYAEPKNVKNKSELVEDISRVLELDEASIEARLDMTKDWVSLAQDLSQEQRNKIVKLGLKGVGFEEGMRRSYPEASLAAHVLGFVGKTEKGDNTGYFGIEGFYDKDLIGLPGFVTSERDLFGRLILLGNQEKIESEDGRDLTLTIDSSVQRIVKERLVKALETYKAKQGCVA